MTSFGVNVRLSDLYPELYPTADGYLTREPLDASACRTSEACFRVGGRGLQGDHHQHTPQNERGVRDRRERYRACGEGRQLDLSRRCSDRSGELSRAGCFISTGRPSTAIFFAVGGPGGSRGAKEVRCMLTRGMSGGRRQVRPIYEGSYRQGRGETTHRLCVRPRRLTASARTDSGNVNKFAVNSVRWAVTEFRYERSRSADLARRQVL